MPEPLFNWKEVVTPAPANDNSEPAGMSIKPRGMALGTQKGKFADMLPRAEKEQLFFALSRGNWSMHHVAEHLLSLTGPAKVLFTTWAISEEPIKTLLRLCDKGLISSLTLLGDTRIPQYAPNAWQLAQKNVAQIFLTKIHAKVMIVQNDEWAYVVNASANWTVNRRIESYTIIESRELALFAEKELLTNCTTPYEPR